MIRYICGLNNINLLKIKRHVHRAKKDKNTTILFDKIVLKKCIKRIPI